MTQMLTLREFRTGLEYHDILNPVLWANDTLLPEVRAKLNDIAANFVTFLKMDVSKITDIVITGSNCNYNYSPQSDIDLHVVADFNPESLNAVGETIESTFTAFKTLYNDSHHILVHGVPIEVYVQPSTETFTSNAGVFSLKKNRWLQHPVKTFVEVDDREVQRKAKPIMREIDQVVHGKGASVIAKPQIKALKAKIKQLRAAGLEAGGEFGIENLAFKAIRNAGYLDKLSKYSDALNDDDLSL